MKKIYFLFLMALLPLVASADATVQINGIYYNCDLEAKTAEVTSHPNDYSGEVVIPKTITFKNIVCDVTAIGNKAFMYCYNLTSVTIPNSVTSIGCEAFEYCRGLTSITIPNSVTSIGYDAFRDCSSLTSVTISNSVTSIGSGAFYGTPWYNYQPDGVVYAGKVLYKYKGTIPAGTKISIKEGTLGIAENAFSLCSGLTSVIIPNSVISIGSRAFGWTGLTSVTIPNGVTYIGDETFCGCTSLASVTIGNSVTSIGQRSFCGCSSLTSITIPNSVTSIGYYAFDGCSGLTSVTIPNSVTSIGNYAFYGCSGLTSVTIPNSVTTIGEYTFGGCSGLTSITTPNNVKSIRNNAFYRCSSLTSVTIGNGIEKIESSAFGNCPELTDVYCFAEEVPYTGGNNPFEDSYIEYATLHVPSVSVDTYKAAEPWSGFKDVVPIAATVKLNKTKATLEKTKTLTLKATVTPSDLLDKSVTWKSSNTAVATVTSSGKVKGVKAGTATITCTSNLSGSKATCKVTIGYVKLDQTEATITKGKTLTLTPTVYPSSLTDKSVTWKSSNTAVATVSSDGTVKGVKAGTATITCTSNATGLSTTCAVTVINGSITLNKSEAALEKGKTVTLKATLTPSDLSDKSVTWKSSNTKVATVSSSGKVTAVKTGTATITCTSVALGLSATCKVTVGKVSLDKTEMILKKGKTETLTATVYPSSLEDKSVTWKSSDTNIATVTTAGKVKGIKDGTVTITCTSNATGLKATCTVKVVTGSVTLDKSEVAVQKGKTLTLTATVTPTTLEDKSVTWTSSNTEVATVSSTGKVKGVKYGTATITCTSNATGLSATCKVTVGKVIISMSEFTLKKSRGITLEAIVYPSTLADKSVIWESSDTEIATVTSEGRVKGIKAGTATITCTSVATGLKGTCTVTVLSTSESRSTDGNDDNVTGIKELEENSVATEPYDVYDLSGRKVRHQVNSLDGLPDGIYIVNGRKILKK